MRFLKDLAELTYANPIFRMRLRHHSAYSFVNLWLATAVLLVAAAGFYRYGIVLERLRFIAMYPPDMQKEIGDSYFDVWEAGGDGGLAGASENAAWFLQFLALLLLSVPGLFRLRIEAQRLFGARSKIFDDELRLTSISARQVFIARMDWPFLKLALAFLLCVPFFLLPGRVTNAPILMNPFWTFLHSLFYYRPWVVPEWTLLLLGCLGWMFLFTLHRWIWLFRALRGAAFRTRFAVGWLFLVVPWLGIYVADEYSLDEELGKPILFFLTSALGILWIWCVKREAWYFRVRRYIATAALIYVLWVHHRMAAEGFVAFQFIALFISALSVPDKIEEWEKREGENETVPSPVTTGPATRFWS